MVMLIKIERYLQRQKMPPTRFGREVAGDPRLVFDLRRGREMGRTLSARVEAYLKGVSQ